MIASLFRGKYSKEEKTGQRINARYEDIISRAGGEYELITTVHELMQHTFAKYASKNCFGTRTYLGEHTPEGAASRSRCSARRRGSRTARCSTARPPSAPARRARLQAHERRLRDPTGPYTILLWEDTCADWFTALVGAGGQSIAVATSYATLDDAVAEALNNSQCPVIVCNFSKISECAALKSKCKDLTTVIYTHHFTSEADIKKAAQVPGPLVISFDDVCKLKKETAFTAPTPSTISVIMYTSGSTGKPRASRSSTSRSSRRSRGCATGCSRRARSRRARRPTSATCRRRTSSSSSPSTR